VCRDTPLYPTVPAAMKASDVGISVDAIVNIAKESADLLTYFILKKFIVSLKSKILI